MYLDEYQILALETAVYPNKGDNLEYPLMGLVGGAGELANDYKKIQLDDNGEITEGRRQKLMDELGDVLWYVSACSLELDYTLEKTAVSDIHYPENIPETFELYEKLLQHQRHDPPADPKAVAPIFYLGFCIRNLNKHAGEMAKIYNQMQIASQGLNAPYRRQFQRILSNVLKWCAFIALELGPTLEETAVYNIGKLKARYQQSTIEVN